MPILKSNNIAFALFNAIPSMAIFKDLTFSIQNVNAKFKSRFRHVDYDNCTDLVVESIFSEETCIAIKELDAKAIVENLPLKISIIEKGIQYQLTSCPIISEDRKLIGILNTFQVKSDDHAIDSSSIDHTSKILETVELTKNRISNDLHDDLGQSLTLIKFAIQNDAPKAHVFDLINSSLENLRDLNKDLSPEMLKKQCLYANIYQLFKRINLSKVGIDFRLDIGDLLPEVEPETALHIYRIIQELINNICKHSDASFCNLIIDIDQEILTFTMKDDGKIFTHSDEDKISEGFGLKSIASRLEITGAVLKHNTVVYSDQLINQVVISIKA